MRAQRAPLRLTVSPARLCRAVYAGFLAVRWRTILAWDSKSHGGTMPEGYLHLTCEQRCQIYALLQSGHSQADIARKIGVDPSTISRELVRNTGACGYRFKQAHEKASQRRKEASDKPRKMTPDLVELIEEKLTREQWSPDQISGRLAKDGVACISHERIYQHVWKDKKDGGKLYLHLRHSGKKYNKRKGKNSGRGLIPNRVDIDQRPSVVAAKSRIGDWEADTIIGANHRGAVMSHVERKSKYTKLAKLPDKSADSVVQACARVLLPLADRIETITYDNGKDDLLQIEWVKWGGFSQVECDSKGFFVNVTVTSSRHVCAHAKIDQDEAPER